MPLKFDDFTQLFEGKGSPAGKFNPTIFVYSEWAVRQILLEFEKKLIQNLQPTIMFECCRHCKEEFGHSDNCIGCDGI